MMEPDDRVRAGSHVAAGATRSGPRPDPGSTTTEESGPIAREGEPREGGRTVSGLLDQGRHLFRRGRLQQAIHVWTRILFLDRDNRAARQAIEHAKRVIAERQRELDALVLEAARREAAGDRHGAQKRLTRVLTLDPRHAEGGSLWEKIEEQERRGEARSGSLSLAGTPTDDEVPTSQRRRVAPRPTVKTESASPLKMAAFLFSALSLFAAGGLYLHLNWDFLVSDGRPLNSSDPEIAPVDHRALPNLPPLSEIHYFNGARLYAKGLYREALSELALVNRGNANFEEARSLILRIEGRLLRGAVMAGVPEDSLARNERGE